ncbi:hypothetical protein M0813_03267 [Anaeramoeba flamelloides]|uniref:Activator of Hsp90 ATPase AHSA1-like N-terminal domain-containing protein n=1 Tax=Anaeramoeba flamelloides TaxID=1746091 RepID=A0ABQ8Y2Y9_9EUKA|nr:hypothetical protein M0813_03267 [Anaeramoeba flamelloides]
MSKWNTNDYHWEEINLDKFAKEQLKEALTTEDLGFDEFQNGKIERKKVVVSGEAYLTIRKRKRILGYSLKIKMEFKGYLNLQNEEGKGTETEIKKEKKHQKFSASLEIVNISETEEEDDYVVYADCKENIKQVTEFLKKTVYRKVLEELDCVIHEMREK